MKKQIFISFHRVLAVLMLLMAGFVSAYGQSVIRRTPTKKTKTHTTPVTQKNEKQQFHVVIQHVNVLVSGPKREGVAITIMMIMLMPIRVILMKLQKTSVSKNSKWIVDMNCGDVL